MSTHDRPALWSSVMTSFFRVVDQTRVCTKWQTDDSVYCTEICVQHSFKLDIWWKAND